MADNIIRRDIVQIGWEVEASPIADLAKGANSLKTSLNGITDDSLSKVAKTANESAASVNKLQASIDKADAILAPMKSKFNALVHPIQTLSDKTETLTNNVKTFASTKITKFKNSLSETVSILTEGQDGIKGFTNSIKNLGKISLSGIAGAAQKLKNNLTSIGRTSLKSLNSGMKKLGDHLKTALQTAGKLAAKLGGLTVKGLAVGAAAMGTAAAAAGVGVFKLTEMASDLSETQNKISVAFGDGTDVLSGYASEVNEWADSSITNMGLAKQTAMDMAALFGDMGTSMGLTQGEAADMSMNLTQLGADLASFKNMNIDEVTTALNGVFTGETESLKRLGVVMTQANLEQFALTKGISKGLDEMTEAEKVQLRYAYVMEKTSNAHGDFVRTGGGFANQLRMLKEQFKEMGTNIGKNFLKPLESGMKKLNGFATELNNIFKDGFQEGDMGKVADVIGRALSEGMNALKRGLPKIIDFVSTIFTTLAQTILPVLPEIAMTLLEGAGDLFGNLLDIIRDNKGVIIQGLLDLANSLISTLLTLIPEFIVLGTQFIVEFAAGFAQQLPSLIPLAVQAILTIVDGLLSCMDQLIVCAIQIINGLVDGLIANLPLLITAAITLLLGLAQGLLNNIQLIINAALNLVNALVQGLIQNLPLLLQAALQLVMGILQGILNNLELILQGAMMVIQALIIGIAQNLPAIIQAGIEVMVQLIVGIVKAIPELIAMIPTIFMSFVEGLLSMDWLQLGKDILTSLGSGILNGVKEIGGSIWEGVKGIFKGDKDGSDAKTTGVETMNSYASGLTDGTSGISSATSTIGSTLSTNLSTDLTGIGTNTIGTYSTGLSGGLQGVTGLTSDVSSGIQTDLDLDINTQGLGTMSTYNTGLTVGGNDATALANSTANNIQSTFASLDLNESGKQIMNGLIEGMNSMRSAVIATASEIAASVKNTINQALDINSPSGVAEWQMKMYGAGLVRGADKALPDVRAASTGISDAIYMPESSHSSTSQTVNNTYAPSFNLTMNGTVDRTTERTIKQWVQASLDDYFASLGRRMPRTTEV